MAKKERASASEVRAKLNELRGVWGWTPGDINNLLKTKGPGRSGSGKGSGYERELCKLLSLWWTNQERDDIFWRSSGSGARAKVRGRAGRATAGQHGDIAATDPIGKPLIDLFTIEIKRGYSGHTVQDMLDVNPTGGVQVWEDFFAQTIESHEQAGSWSWLLITRRDRREPMVWFPRYTLTTLRAEGVFGTRPEPFIEMRVNIRHKLGKHCLSRRHYTINACGMLLTSWLGNVKPAVLLKIADEV